MTVGPGSGDLTCWQYLAVARGLLRVHLLRALDEVAEEPSWGRPGRYRYAGDDPAFKGHIIDLTVADDRIVYRLMGRAPTPSN